MFFFGHANDLELFLRQIGTTAQALIRRLASASAFLKTTFFFLFFFFFFVCLFLLMVFCPLLFQPEPFFVFWSLRMLGFFRIWLVWFCFVLLCLAFFQCPPIMMVYISSICWTLFYLCCLLFY